MLFSYISLIYSIISKEKRDTFCKMSLSFLNIIVYYLRNNDYFNFL